MQKARKSARPNIRHTATRMSADDRPTRNVDERTDDDASSSSKREALPSYDHLIATHGAGAFFELANAPTFRYEDLRVSQNQSVADSCGGIVWESAFCLARYLRANARFRALTTRAGCAAVELGCGCALVGLLVARDYGFERVVVTDQEKVLADVTRANVEMNVEALEARGASTVPRAMALDWEKEEELDAVVAAGPYDVVFGTDVLFSVPLVGKLVHCVERLMKKKKHSVCYVCVQRRSPDAHEEFLRLAKEKFEFFRAEDVSFAEDDECEVFELRWRREDLLKRKRNRR